MHYGINQSCWFGNGNHKSTHNRQKRFKTRELLQSIKLSKITKLQFRQKKQQITNFQIKHGNIAKLQFHKFISTKYEDIVFLRNLILSPKSKFAAIQ